MKNLTPAEIKLINLCFMKFYELNWSKINRVISRDDFVQECWVKLIRTTYNESRGKLTTFSFLVAKSCYSNLLKKFYCQKNAARFTESVEDLALIENNNLSTQPDRSNIYRDEHNKILQNMILGKQQFPAKYLYALLESGRSPDEISEYLKTNCDVEISSQGIKRWTHQLRRRLNTTYVGSY